MASRRHAPAPPRRDGGVFIEGKRKFMEGEVRTVELC